MSGESLREAIQATGHPTSEWTNGPGYRYAPHSHRYTKVLGCLEGSIVFHIGGQEVSLSAGEQTVVAAGVEHAATVGPSGVRCIEAHVT